MMLGFDCFIGIDWSGDMQPRQKGLKVAVAYPGRAAPQLEQGPTHNGRWSRTEVMTWIEKQFQDKRALIGLDFAFGFPPTSLPGNVILDWDYVERICGSAANFYGGAFFRPPACVHSHLVNSRWLPKQGYSADLLRLTEVVAMETPGARPQSVFNAVGAAQVGPSSISGMRALRYLKEKLDDRIAIWPFSEARGANSVLVEIFPRYFPLSKGLSPKLANHATLNFALDAFESDHVRRAPESEDEGDALLSAAALRFLSVQESLFGLPDQSIRSQGWIFGVPLPSGKTS